MQKGQPPGSEGAGERRRGITPPLLRAAAAGGWGGRDSSCGCCERAVKQAGATYEWQGHPDRGEDKEELGESSTNCSLPMPSWTKMSPMDLRMELCLIWGIPDSYACPFPCLRIEFIPELWRGLHVRGLDRWSQCEKQGILGITECRAECMQRVAQPAGIERDSRMT